VPQHFIGIRKCENSKINVKPLILQQVIIINKMIKTGNPVISIYTEMTPNPETMKFVANKLLYPGKSIDFPDVDSAKPSLLAQELFTFPFIKSVFIAIL
jgi:hypothetical protein